MVKKLFSDWKVHLICIIFIVCAELIGPIPFKFKVLSFSLLPMLFVLIFGIILSIFKAIPKKVMKQASPCITIATLWLVTRLCSSIGPNVEALFKAGPALILQEFGNLVTVFLAVPVAVFLFNMGRQAVGAGFSNSREGSIAIVGGMYGLDSEEGQGVMGAYITGTLFGTIFCGLLASALMATNIFHPYSLAMAAGTGSASMMAAAMAPLMDAFPNLSEEISAYATTSNLLSSVDGLYMSIFIAIPATNWLYKKLKGPERHQRVEARRIAKKAAKTGTATMVSAAKATAATTTSAVINDKPKAEAPKISYKETWLERGKILGFSGIFLSIGNYISTNKAGAAVSPLDAIPALLLMLCVIVLSFLIDDLLKAKTKINLPTIIYISILGIIASLPYHSLGPYFVEQVSKIGVLAACTPLLAYAGIAIGKDLDGFKKQGVGIICTTLMALIGTYVGSAIIAQIILKIQNII